MDTPRSRSLSADLRGFDLWLHLAQKRHHFDTHPLSALKEYTSEQWFKAGQVLMHQSHGTLVDMDTGSLYFVESGMISKKRDPHQSLSAMSRNSLMKVDRASVELHMREFRFARFGPGWCVGLEDLFSSYRAVGVFEAETDCVVHMLPFKTVKHLQETRPELIVQLYSLLGRLMTRQFNRTKERLGHVTDSLYTSAARKDMASRRTMRLVGTLARQLSM